MMSRWPAARLAALVLTLCQAGSSAVLADATGAVTGTVQVSGLLVDLQLSTDSPAVGQPVQAKVTVSNAGIDELRQIKVTLRFDAEGLRLSGPAIKTIGHLGPGKDASTSWSIRGQTPGRYVLLAQATSEGITVESAAVALQFTE